MAYQIFTNPPESKLGFKAYNNYFSNKNEVGELNVWLQPSSIFLENLFDNKLSLQIQQATINIGCERGNHFHPYEKAFDCFYLEKGAVILGFDNIEKQVQEFYQVQEGTVCIFPPFVAHTVWNKGVDVVRFTTFRTWNYGIKRYVTPHKILLNDSVLKEVQNSRLVLINGLFGFDDFLPTTQQRNYIHDSNIDYRS